MFNLFVPLEKKTIIDVTCQRLANDKMMIRFIGRGFSLRMYHVIFSRLRDGNAF